jgi:hypothetical protein
MLFFFIICFFAGAKGETRIGMFTTVWVHPSIFVNTSETDEKLQVKQAKAQLHERLSARMSAGPPVDQVIYPSGHDGLLVDVHRTTSGPSDISFWS